MKLSVKGEKHENLNIQNPHYLSDFKDNNLDQERII